MLLAKSMCVHECCGSAIAMSHALSHTYVSTDDLELNHESCQCVLQRVFVWHLLWCCTPSILDTFLSSLEGRAGKTPVHMCHFAYACMVCVCLCACMGHTDLVSEALMEDNVLSQ